CFTRAICARKSMISAIRSANRPRGVHGVDDAEAYLDARYHSRHHRHRALAFTRAARRCQRGASSSSLPFDAAYAAVTDDKLEIWRDLRFSVLFKGDDW